MISFLISLVGVGAPFAVDALTCPKPDAGLVGDCAMNCFEDDECGSGEMCCSNGCGLDCVEAVESVASNPVCPDTTEMVGHCGLFCAGDADCAGGRLCCDTGCGTDCMEAVEGFIGNQKGGRKRNRKGSSGDRENGFGNDAGGLGLGNNAGGFIFDAAELWNSDLVCPKVDEGVVGHCAEMCFQDQQCGRGELCCSNGCGHQCTKAVVVEAGNKQPEMCPASREQRCRRRCPEVECAEDECLMRNDRCCDLTCEKKKAVVEEPPVACSWKSSVCDPKNDDQCAEGYTCDPKACVPSVCNCQLVDGKPSFMCTADCNPGCVKKEEAAICNEDRHCGFLGKCDGGRCSLQSEVSFEDVEYACVSVYGDESCKSTGCGKKANKKGRCVPKNSTKVSCKTVGDEALCNLLKCKFKKGACSGKSRLE